MKPQTKYVRNILKMYGQTPIGLAKSGKEWYLRAHYFARTLSEKYKVSLDKVCGVISCLSAGVSWETNMNDATKFIASHSLGLLARESMDAHNYSTYSANVFKAERICNSLSPVETHFSESTGAKTRHFYLNILAPKMNTGATIDRHAYAIALGNDAGQRPKIHPALYKRIENAYIIASERVGLLPHELQAITWVAYKQLNNI